MENTALKRHLALDPKYTKSLNSKSGIKRAKIFFLHCAHVYVHVYVYVYMYTHPGDFFFFLQPAWAITQKSLSYNFFRLSIYFSLWKTNHYWLLSRLYIQSCKGHDEESRKRQQLNYFCSTARKYRFFTAYLPSLSKKHKVTVRHKGIDVIRSWEASQLFLFPQLNQGTAKGISDSWLSLFSKQRSGNNVVC